EARLERGDRRTKLLERRRRLACLHVARESVLCPCDARLDFEDPGPQRGQRRGETGVRFVERSVAQRETTRVGRQRRDLRVERLPRLPRLPRRPCGRGYGLIGEALTQLREAIGEALDPLLLLAQ